MTKHWAVADIDKLIELGRQGLMWRDVANRLERHTENCRSRFGQTASAEDKMVRIAEMAARGWLDKRVPREIPQPAPQKNMIFSEDPAALLDRGSPQMRREEPIRGSAIGCAAAEAVNFCF